MDDRPRQGVSRGEKTERTSLSSTREYQDRIEILELAARYNHAAVSLDPNGYASCFTPEGRFYSPTRERDVTGQDALRAMLSENAIGNARGIQHLTTDFIIKLEGDRATQTCQFILYGERDGSGNRVLGAGTYSDTLVRTAEGWRYSERIAEVWE